MMAKTDVNGDNAEPVYKWMKEQPNGAGFLVNAIKWVRLRTEIQFTKIIQNFTKFLINRDGQVVERYSPRFESADMKDDIVELLF